MNLAITTASFDEKAAINDICDRYPAYIQQAHNQLIGVITNTALGQHQEKFKTQLTEKGVLDLFCKKIENYNIQTGKMADPESYIKDHQLTGKTIERLIAYPSDTSFKDAGQILEFTLALLSFYKKASDYNSMQILTALPYLLALELKVSMICFSLAALSERFAANTEKIPNRLKGGTKRTKTKEQKDWAELCQIINELNDSGNLTESKSFEKVVERVKMELQIRNNNESLTGHNHSMGTVRTCLKKIFEVNPDNFKPGKNINSYK